MPEGIKAENRGVKFSDEDMMEIRRFVKANDSMPGGQSKSGKAVAQAYNESHPGRRFIAENTVYRVRKGYNPNVPSKALVNHAALKVDQISITDLLRLNHEFVTVRMPQIRDRAVEALTELRDTMNFYRNGIILADGDDPLNIIQNSEVSGLVKEICEMFPNQ